MDRIKQTKHLDNLLQDSIQYLDDPDFRWKLSCKIQKMLTKFDVEEYLEAEKYYKSCAAKAIASITKILKNSYPQHSFKVKANPTVIPCGNVAPVVITVITDSFAELTQDQKTALLFSAIHPNLPKSVEKLILRYRFLTNAQEKELKNLDKVYGKNAHRE